MRSVHAGVFALKATIVVATILLISFGAAIYAAPVTVPLLSYATWSDRFNGRWRVVAASTLILTTVQCAWAITYLIVGESTPAIWLIPVVVFAIVASLLGISLVRSLAKSDIS